MEHVHVSVVRLVPFVAFYFCVACGALTDPESPELSLEPSMSAVEGIETVDIGTLGGDLAAATAVNELAHVAGFSTRTGGDPFTGAAFLWHEREGMLDFLPSVEGLAIARGLNDRGHVVGQYTTLVGTQAFFWSPATGFAPIGTLGGTFSFANDINNAGKVVGYSTVASGDFHAFSWTLEKGFHDLGFVDTFAHFAGISVNEIGQVAGGRATPSREEAVVWSPEGDLTVLPSLGGFRNATSGINNLGQVVGVSRNTANEDRAVLWEPWGAIVEIEGLSDGSSWALDVNDLSQVVGQTVVDLSAGPVRRPWVWTADGGTVELETLGAVGGAPRAINNEGMAVGQSVNETGSEFRALVWYIDFGPGSPLLVPIDIMPRRENVIDPSSDTWIPVVILASEPFAAQDVDPRTVTLGDNDGDDVGVAVKSGGSGLRAEVGDWNGDGDMDLLVLFSTAAMLRNGDLTSETAQLVLNGLTFDGDAIRGIDGVQVMGLEGM